VAGRTLAGARAAPLPPADREGVISFPRRPPATTLGSLAFEIEVTVENRSSVVWPALGVLPDHLVRPGVRWRLPDGRVLEEIADAGFVSLDLAPGERCRAFVGAAAPPGHERLLLEIGLTQDGTWFPGTVTLALQVLSPRSAAAAR
jgi:hypothetical protein